MRKKGFTLIELLAVIIILAVIALITTPIVLNLIKNARIQAFKDTGYGIIESAKYYYLQNSFDDTLAEETTFTFPESGLSFKGEDPKGGTLVLYSDGRTKLDIYNDNYCATKETNENEVAVGETKKDSDGNFLGCEIILTDQMKNIKRQAEDIIKKVTATENKMYDFPNSGIEGITEPDSGTLQTTSDGKISLTIYSGEYCAVKGYNDEEVSVGVASRDSNGNITGCNIKVDESVVCSSEIWNGTTDTSWYNSTDTEFTITTSSQLAGVAKLVNEGTDNFTGKTIKLGCNINLNDTSNYDSWATTAPSNTWTPIGNSNIYFAGNLNGDNFSINGLYIDTEESYQGLFGNIKDASITNLTMSDSYVETNQSFSAIIAGNATISQKDLNFVNINIENSQLISTSSEGYNLGGIIGIFDINSSTTRNLSFSNINTNLNIEAPNTMNVGGVIGHMANLTNPLDESKINFTMNNIKNNAKVNALTNIGGAIGLSTARFNEFNITNFINFGNIKSENNPAEYLGVGGIIGAIGSDITNFSLNDIGNNANVIANQNNIGGIIGNLYLTGNIRINNINNFANIKGKNNTAGLIGYYNTTSPGLIINSQNGEAGIIESSLSNIGGLVGYGKALKFDRCFNKGQVSGAGYVGGIIGRVSEDYLKIANSLNTGDILGTDSKSYYGGLVGSYSIVQTESSIINSYNAGRIEVSGNYVGGIAGSGAERIENTYNVGTIISRYNGDEAYIGGIIGYADYMISLTNNYSRGTITTNTTKNVGAIIGSNISNSLYVNNYYLVGTYNNAIGATNENSILPDVTGKYEKITNMPSIISVVNGNNAFYEIDNNVYPGINYDFDYEETEDVSDYTDASCFTMNTSGLITDYDSNCPTTVKISPIINKIVVKGIASKAFEGTNVEEIIFVEGIETIGSSAFYNVSTLTGTLVIPKSVKVIDASAFAGTSIEEVDFSNASNLTTIQMGAFLNTQLKKLDLSGATSLTEIPGHTFDIATLTGTLVIPKSVSTIDSGAFSSTSITGLDLSQATSLTTIPSGVFNLSTLAGTIIIPSWVEVISSSAFEGTSITGLDLSNADNLITIGSRAFYNVSALTGTIVIPSKVSTIEANAFVGTKITGLDLSQATSLTMIPSGVFNLSTLTGDIVIPSSVTTISTDAFKNTGFTGLDLSQATSLTMIPSGVFNLSTLTGDIVIPSSVEKINSGAFAGTKIEKLDLSKADSLTTISAGAFNITTLTGTIVIPSKVSTIEANAFVGTKITGLDLSQATSLTTIPSGVFNLSTLTGTIVIPSSVTTISTDAFKNTGFTGLDLSRATSLTTIPSGVFNLSTLTGDIVIPSKVSTIGANAFTGTKITSLDLSNATNLTTIGSSAFTNISTLTGTIVIPSSVITIESGAFYKTGITGLDLSNADSLTTISAGAFNSVTTLTGKVTFPSSLTTINSAAFTGAGISEYDFTNVTSDLTFVDGTFAGNLNLTTIKVNSNHSFEAGSLSGSPVSKIIVNAPHTSPITLAQGHSSTATVTIQYNDGKCSADYNSTFTDC